MFCRHFIYIYIFIVLLVFLAIYKLKGLIMSVVNVYGDKVWTRYLHLVLKSINELTLFTSITLMLALTRINDFCMPYTKGLDHSLYQFWAYKVVAAMQILTNNVGKLMHCNKRWTISFAYIILYFLAITLLIFALTLHSRIQSYTMGPK